MTEEYIKSEYLPEIRDLASELRRRFLTREWIDYNYVEGDVGHDLIYPEGPDEASLIMYHISTDIGSKVASMVPRSAHSKEGAREVKQSLERMYRKCTIVGRKDGSGWDVSLQRLRFHLYDPQDADRTCVASFIKLLGAETHFS